MTLFCRADMSAYFVVARFSASSASLSALSAFQSSIHAPRVIMIAPWSLPPSMRLITPLADSLALAICSASCAPASCNFFSPSRLAAIAWEYLAQPWKVIVIKFLSVPALMRIITFLVLAVCESLKAASFALACSICVAISLSSLAASVMCFQVPMTSCLTNASLSWAFFSSMLFMPLLLDALRLSNLSCASSISILNLSCMSCSALYMTYMPSQLFQTVSIKVLS
mmetsp:Transcript_60738/g.169810  ORF Transcript_60738/g.169810 Transcript_60738/m.169810 type:complete len:226 (+) Transcript_60738:340-1017(+)